MVLCPDENIECVVNFRKQQVDIKFLCNETLFHIIPNDFQWYSVVLPDAFPGVDVVPR